MALADLIEQGGEALFAAARNSLHTNGTSAHIPYQNAAEQQMATILNAYNAGQISNSVAQQRILATDQNFTHTAQTFGYARALQGARDIDALAQKILQDLQNVATGMGTPVTATPGATLSAGITQLTSNPIALVGIGFLIYKMAMAKGRF
jgi:hypothetical protein